jgi:thiopeptide-type bacteriocin biosynthesis protein
VFEADGGRLVGRDAQVCSFVPLAGAGAFPEQVLALDDTDLTHWIAAFGATGRDLGRLAHDGTLQRGLRAVLAHHIIFHWNRAGLSHDAQALFARAASAVVLG